MSDDQVNDSSRTAPQAAEADGSPTPEDRLDGAPTAAESVSPAETREEGTADAGPDLADAAPAEPAPQYGIGPFSLREVIIGGVWLIAFVVSFFSLTLAQFTGGSFSSVWTDGISWVLAIAVPTVAVFLLALRRLSPTGIRRVGSLGIDQFASVAFSVSAIWWIQHAWEGVQFAVQHRTLVPYSWVVWVETVLMLAGVVLTVFAPLIPGLAEDFHGRPEAPAHRNARPVRAVTPRPAPVAAARAAVPVAVADESPAATDEVAQEPSDEAPSSQQAFWALVPEERAVVDESGSPVFMIGPTAWALVIEDRGDRFVVRHEDGRTGYLRDVSGVTRG